MASLLRIALLCSFLCLMNVILGKTLPEPYKRFGQQQPQQINIAIGDSEDEIVITWFTAIDTRTSKVSYGPDLTLRYEKEGVSEKIVDGGFSHRKMWFHRVRLTNLTEDTFYVYRCGSDDGWSDVFYFKTMKKGTDWPVSVALYGDMGIINPQALSRVQMEAQNRMYDAVIHIGDFAYDMHTYNSKFADAFMNRIEPIAAYVPYMVSPGNHEMKYNFSNFKTRFTMPMYEQSRNMFYSWNMGPVHFVSVNTEAYYYFEYGVWPLINMYKWLIADLEEATKPEVREERPWIILYGHRPMYCSNNDTDDCTKENCAVRVGVSSQYLFGMEKILAKYGIDLAVWAHEHSYERLWPLYDYQVLNGTGDNPYDNPRGPVHIITGSAGCIERRTPFKAEKPYWSASRSTDYGYTRLKVYNKTHLYWEQVSDDKNGATVDQVWLIRDKHESYAYLLQGRESI